MTSTGDFELSAAELRAVAAYATAAAESVLEFFGQACPEDPRPREAIAAAHEFIAGTPRSRRQRVASMDAHRAAKAAPGEIALLAAQAAGDAASAAYLHPISKAHQVGHILRAAANAARIRELLAPEDPQVGERMIRQFAQHAGPVLVDVLRRYPPAPPGRSRSAQLMAELDGLLR
ncbi:exonuclease SbcC [Corynebacterium hylobatis]|uniref:Exonuclease SbcC n=1 Tax=Corynebacterium hylobatis TaxID=1859290 RepID=A0A3S0C0D3_9CORY|nr:exonuclease SbcC [Corynebacterium hylobatis]RSZ62103.1 exonuclease SbcC [Corynebacterium hylobatis]